MSDYALPRELTDEHISELFSGTRFGTPGDTPIGRKGLMVECVLKAAAGYSAGSTITQICVEAGLLTGSARDMKPTKAGSRWAFRQIYDSRATVLERLSECHD